MKPYLIVITVLQGKVAGALRSEPRAATRKRRSEPRDRRDVVDDHQSPKQKAHHIGETTGKGRSEPRAATGKRQSEPRDRRDVVDDHQSPKQKAHQIGETTGKGRSEPRAATGKRRSEPRDRRDVVDDHQSPKQKACQGETPIDAQSRFGTKDKLVKAGHFPNPKFLAHTKKGSLSILLM